MTAPGAPARATADVVTTVTELVMANGWSNPTKIAEALSKAASRPAAFDTPFKALVSLFEQGIITREQLNELDGLMQQQVNFPTYRLIKKLGAGGMGTVYLAIQQASGRKLALKTIIGRLKEDADFVGRFHRESKVLIGLSHRNIAEVIESGESSGVCYMAMEYINGPSLASLLRSHQVLPELYVLRLCRQVAEGLAYVYDKAELVHRDIKPENVLIARTTEDASEPFPLDDVAKLIDFGLVKPVDDDERLTQTGMTIGTPLYMSPEQIRGEKIDCRSDIYGLAATMYHLLTGVTPFAGTSPGSIMSAHLTQDVPDPGTRVPSLLASTRELVVMAMAKKAADRFLTFEGFIKALDRAISQLDEKHLSAPRLLRKPLVLKGPVRKTMDRPVTQSGEHSVNPQADHSVQSLSSRIVRKFKEGQGAPAGNSPIHQALPALPPAGAAPSAPAAASAGPPPSAGPSIGNAADALRVATTSTFNKKRSLPGSPVSGGNPLPGGGEEKGYASRLDPRIAAAAMSAGQPKAVAKQPAGETPAPAPANPIGVPFSAPPQPARPSAVFDEDPESSLSIGAIPWLVLGATLLIVIGWWLLHG
jgi:serine/threonine protein kinase